VELLLSLMLSTSESLLSLLPLLWKPKLSMASAMMLSFSKPTSVQHTQLG
jgi:hypothetical protein